MSVNVWIPPFLRLHTSGAERVAVPAGTVRSVLVALGAAGAEALAGLAHDGDAAGQGVALFLNGDRLGSARLDIAATAGDEIAIVPGIRGGW